MNILDWLWIPGAAYLALTLALGPALRRAAGAESAAPRWRFLHRVLLILAVSAAADGLIRWLAPDALASPAAPRLREAWFIFWSVVAGTALAELLFRLPFVLRGRTPPIPDLLLAILRGVAVLVTLFLVLRSGLGINITPLLASTALVTAVVGFALQGVLGNLLAGMSLHLVRSFHKDDWIAVGENAGRVVATNWRETRLRAVNGQTIVLPNSLVAAATVTNYSQPDPVRRHEAFAMADFRHAPGEVAEAMLAAARSVPAVLAEPPPSVHAVEFRDWGVRYRLFFWTREFQREKTLGGEIGNRVWYEFQRRGIRIPFPAGAEGQLAATWARGDGPQGSLPAPDPVSRVAELLGSAFGRQYLTDEQGQPLIRPEEAVRVGAHLRRACYGPGEVLFRQGEAGDWCGVLLRGRLDGRIRAEEREGTPFAATAFAIEPGALFGEMSLLTGQPRSATLSALAHCEVLEIPLAAFRELLSLRADLPERLSRLVAARAAGNEAAQAQARAAGAGNPAVAAETLLKRFLRLLGKE